MKRLLSVLFVFAFVLGVSINGNCAEGDLSVSGFLSADVGYSNISNEDGTNDESSDVFVYGFGLELTAGIVENVKGDVIFLYEEGAGDADIYGLIDAAYLTCQKGITYAKLGKIYLPFADAGTSFLVDPYTLSIGETRASTAVLGVEASIVTFEVGAFNGDSDKIGKDDKIDDIFAALTVTPVSGDDLTIAIKAEYLSDITETFGLFESFVDADGVATGYADRSGAYCASLNVKAKTGALLVEYVTAEDDMTDMAGAKPQALNVEVTTTVVDDFMFGIKYEDSDEFTTLVDGGDSDIQRLGAIASYSLNDQATVALEYLNDKDSTGNSTDTVTAHLGLDF